MAITDLRDKATQLVKYGSEPALATRVSIPNVNLLSTKGSILYGTGGYTTSEASINGVAYRYAKVEALTAPSGTEQFVLSNNSDGDLRYLPVIDNYADYGSKLGVLSASVAYDIDQKLHIANAATGTGISMGNGAKGLNTGAIAIGNNTNAAATSDEDGSFAIAIGGNAEAGNKNIAIGSKAIASSYASPMIQLGTGENRTLNSFQVWDTPMLVNGKIPQTSIWPEINTSGTINIGMNTNGSTDCVVIGNNTNSAKNSVAVGKYAVAKEYGTAIGSASTTLVQNIAGNNSVAVGYGAQAIGEYCVAIGSGATTGPEDNKNYIQIGNIGVGMTMNIGKYQLMDNNGQIPNERLTDALSSINQRLDDLGFKQGNVEWNSKITMSNVELNIAHKNSGYDVYKEGKFCYMDTWFRLDVQSGNASYSELSGLIGTLPKEFWPKSSVISPVGNLIINSLNSYSVEMVYIFIVEDGRILVDKRFGYSLNGISATQRNKYLHFGWETNQRGDI